MDDHVFQKLRRFEREDKPEKVIYMPRATMDMAWEIAKLRVQLITVNDGVRKQKEKFTREALRLEAHEEIFKTTPSLTFKFSDITKNNILNKVERYLRNPKAFD